MNCGVSCIKYLLFIFNFIFVLVGLALLGVGIYIHLQLDDYEALSEQISAPSIALIVLGSIIFIIAFFGCCGTLRESHCMIVTFAVFLLAILIVQVAIGVYAYVIKSDIGSDDWDKTTTEAYTKIFKNFYSEEVDRTVVNTVQSQLKCCGILSSEDFTGATYFRDNNTIPWSCCGAAETSSCDAASSYTQGCLAALTEFFDKLSGIMGGVLIGVAATELVGIVFALCLANSIRNDERRAYRV